MPGSTFRPRSARRPGAAGGWALELELLVALEGMTGFSVLPLKVSTYVAPLVAFGALIYGALLIARTLLFNNSAPGYPSLMVVVLFLGSEAQRNGKAM